MTPTGAGRSLPFPSRRPRPVTGSPSIGPMSAGSQVDDVAVVIPARNEADRIRQTVAAAAGIPGVGLVVVVDDGSLDGTGAVARRAGAVVLRHTSNRGKAAAMQSGANAVGLVDQRERRERPRHLLFLDGELAHRSTGTGLRAQLHRAHQLADVARALAVRR